LASNLGMLVSSWDLLVSKMVTLGCMMVRWDCRTGLLGCRREMLDCRMVKWGCKRGLLENSLDW
jgi:hypothetical protein